MGHWGVEDKFEVREGKGYFRTGYQLNWLYPGPYAKFSGVDMGGKITAIEGGFDNGPVIFKVAGHNSWESIGNTSYNPPHYIIGIIEGIDDHGNNGTFHQKWEITYTKHHAKVAKATAYEIYETLKTNGVYR